MSLHIYILLGNQGEKIAYNKLVHEIRYNIAVPEKSREYVKEKNFSWRLLKNGMSDFTQGHGSRCGDPCSGILREERVIWLKSE